MTQSAKSSPTLNIRPLGWTSATLLGFALIVSIGFFAGFAVPYLLIDASKVERFAGREAWILTHIATGAIAMLVGPFQLWLGLTGRTTTWHRRLGRLYVGCIAFSAATAFYLSVTTEVHWVFGIGLFGLACAWTATTGLALLFVTRGTDQGTQRVDDPQLCGDAGFRIFSRVRRRHHSVGSGNPTRAAGSGIVVLLGVPTPGHRAHPTGAEASIGELTTDLERKKLFRRSVARRLGRFRRRGVALLKTPSQEV